LYNVIGSPSFRIRGRQKIANESVLVLKTITNRSLRPAALDVVALIFETVAIEI